jgi:hypothetical protein
MAAWIRASGSCHAAAIRRPPGRAGRHCLDRSDLVEFDLKLRNLLF